MELLDQKIASLDLALREVAEKDPERTVVDDAAGRGAGTSRAFVLTMGDVTRFARGKQVASSLGLIPREYSSGGLQRLGSISKQGHRFMRMLVVEAAQSSGAL